MLVFSFRRTSEVSRTLWNAPLADHPKWHAINSWWIPGRVGSMVRRYIAKSKDVFQWTFMTTRLRSNLEMPAKTKKWAASMATHSEFRTCKSMVILAGSCSYLNARRINWEVLKDTSRKCHPNTSSCCKSTKSNPLKWAGESSSSGQPRKRIYVRFGRSG